MSKRVAIITDASEHLGPDLARKLANRDHNLVLGGVAKGLANELRALGAEVAIVEEIKGPACLTHSQAVQSLVELAKERFGGFDAAFIRPGVHIIGDVIAATAENFQNAFEGNMMATLYAIQALLPALIEQGKGGQLLICSSAVGVKPYPAAAVYSATRAGAIMLVKNAAQTAIKHGITVNSIGTMFLNYPGFLDATGCRDPQVLEQTLTHIPIGRLGEPAEAAHFAASLLDGESNYINGEFFSVSGGLTST